MRRGRPVGSKKLQGVKQSVVRRTFFLTPEQDKEFNSSFRLSIAKGFSDYVWGLYLKSKEI